VAFRLAGSIEQQQKTLQYLEWREKQYDKRVHVDIYTRHSTDRPAVQGALVYMATAGAQNVNWLGPAGLQDIAKQVAAAVGPSGPNYEYVFRLADAMRKVGICICKGLRDWSSAAFHCLCGATVPSPLTVDVQRLTLFAVH
jgi:cation transport regulator ChaC